MIDTGAIEGAQSPSPRRPDDPDLCLTELVRAVSAILDSLDGPMPPPGNGAGRPRTTPERWEDTYHHYLEIGRPIPPGAEIDISVTNGRAFIRVGR